MNRPTSDIRRVTILFGLSLLISAGCGKSSNPVSPPVTDGFPPSSKFSVTLYSPSQTVAVGDSFEVRVVLYNVSNVAGCALNITYTPSLAEVDSIIPGTSFFPPDSTVGISMVEQDSGRVSYGVAYRYSGQTRSKSGSGIVCTLVCRSRNSGTCRFAIDHSSLELTTPDGTLIPNFSTLQLDSLSILVH